MLKYFDFPWLLWDVLFVFLWSAQSRVFVDPGMFADLWKVTVQHFQVWCCCLSLLLTCHFWFCNLRVFRTDLGAGRYLLPWASFLEYLSCFSRLVMRFPTCADSAFWCFRLCFVVVVTGLIVLMTGKLILIPSHPEGSKEILRCQTTQTVCSGCPSCLTLCIWSCSCCRV